jgi:hypothetical protein
MSRRVIIVSVFFNTRKSNERCGTDKTTIFNKIRLPLTPHLQRLIIYKSSYGQVDRRIWLPLI